MVFTGIAGDIPERKFARVADSERFPALLKESGGEPARRGSGGLGTVRNVTVAGVAGVGSELSRTYVLDRCCICRLAAVGGDYRESLSGKRVTSAALEDH